MTMPDYPSDLYGDDRGWQPATLTPIECTPACKESFRKYRTEAEAYKTAWPEHCTVCGGWGEFSFTENGAPHGAGFWSMPVTEPCEECLGNCPRCGHDIAEDRSDAFYEGNAPCPGCGFVLGVTPGLPPEPECTCWMRDCYQF